MLRREIRPGYTVGMRWLEIGCTVAFFCLTVWSVAKVQALLVLQDMPHERLAVGLGFLGGLLFSDFISGFVHWAADNWGSPHWPILGTGFIRPFREHHKDPMDLTRHDFLELNGQACIIAIPTFFWGAPAAAGGAWEIFVCVFWLSNAYWVLGTNQFHSWAHAGDVPRFVRWLQRRRIILSPEVHNQHHTAPFNRNYCITTGWFNGPLRWIKFFEGIEWTVTAVTGIQPAHYRAPRPESQASSARRAS